MLFTVYNNRMQDGQQPNEPGWVFRPGSDGLHDVPPPTPGLPDVPPEAPAANQTDSLPPSAENPRLTWTASEYIANAKSSSWTMSLIGGTILLAVAALLLTREWISAVAILIAGILFAVFAARQPRTLNYAVLGNGLQVGEKFYPFTMFKSFSLSHDHAVGVISFTPLKRFMLPLTVHYALDDEERIFMSLADYLPYKEHEADMVENITRRIRF